jgi:uncharacterized protein YcfJ
MMDKSLLIGVVAGVAVATTGGVAAYQFLGARAEMAEQGSNVVTEEAPAEAAPAVEVAAAQPAPAPQPRPATAPAPQPAAAPATQPAAEPAPTTEDCAKPKDEHQIAGTALGAVVGGAVAKDVGDRNLTTAVGAAAGAFIGKKIQKKIQENRAEKTADSGCQPAG